MSRDSNTAEVNDVSQDAKELADEPKREKESAISEEQVDVEMIADTPASSESVIESALPCASMENVDTGELKNSEEAVCDVAVTTTIDSPALMMSRDDMAKIEEDSGRLKFDVITNDGTDEHMIQLTTLKNIFAKQLPKMPKEYIVRLVFDKNHRSMLLLKNGKHVIGGICYRPFESNHFAEIAFCAINASDQVKGYGTRLMNHLKEYVKIKNITYFLTYADNYAIGYFKKQGFTKNVSMDRPNWYGYIKDYDGGTLMECTIHTQINYLRITSMIHQQRKAIQDKIRERSRAKTVYPGLTMFADGRLMDIYMVPGVKEAGWSQATIRNSRIGTRDQGSLKSQLLQLLKAVSNHRSAWPFHEPVDTSVVVDYLDHVKDPVDLQLISKRIDSGAYISKAALKADLDKMCDNCTLYNTPDTNYYKAAADLREFIQARIPIRDQK
ncbi:histone acetyltransferase [Plasmopara halstedii]|uniref:histone acetyltransferase n=1 Tax=Plasmopara halstedii TaxID=4781 RepID=A0A0P1B8E3_PLAHL|nr:histone acetyltransferase [Plasmopara halstedii]CEG50449.1 histone acetyltransferase [Plasmopara halstedii]|eukprot:XP_024586818.1 histone acetyltransferase [Plasmopara halstedii]